MSTNSEGLSFVSQAPINPIQPAHHPIQTSQARKHAIATAWHLFPNDHDLRRKTEDMLEAAWNSGHAALMNGPKSDDDLITVMKAYCTAVPICSTLGIEETDPRNGFTALAIQSAWGTGLSVHRGEKK